MKRFFHFLTASSMAFSLLLTPQTTFAEDCDDDICNLNADCCDVGCAYEDCRRAPNISPSYALAFVVTVGIITLLVVNGDSHGISSHSHS